MKKVAILLIIIFCFNSVFAQISEQDFNQPPRDARPSTYWMWMNGNISKEGLTADLEYMKRVGYGGAMMFNVGVGIPQGKVKYASKKWDEMTIHACKEAERLGLELFLHNSPGYSGVGGPWIKPEFSMKQLVWTESMLNSENSGIQLQQPFTKHGFYKDIAVLAYPAANVEKAVFKDVVKTVKVDHQLIDKRVVIDGKLQTKLRLPENQSVLDFELTEEFSAQAISIYRDRELPLDPHDGPRDYPANFSLQVSTDGKNFRNISTVACPALRAVDAPGIASFHEVKGKFYRLITNRPNWISEVVLHASPRLNNWTAKTNFISASVPFDTNNQLVDAVSVIDGEKVIDITNYVSEKGVVNWKAPKGRWNIVRLGYSITGEEPAAAPTSSQGLECDKLSKKGIDQHFDLFLDPLLTKLKPYCGTTLTGLMMDSWEAGKQNWTEELPTFFKTKRGYELSPYLLALTGRIVNSVDETERFLFDFRRTNTDMFNENFLGEFKQRAAKYKLKFAGEPYGDGNFESLEYAWKLDYPMSEFWTHYIYGGVITTKLAASTAHVYGRKIVQAESFTGTPFNSKFTEHPYALKAEGDWMMTNGVNRFVYHVYAHQPYIGQKAVFMTMGPFGTHLNRNSTWAEQAVEWNNYNSRCAAMLQQGQNVADVCIFKAENISSGITDYDVNEPLIPYGYKWDIIGRNALLTQLSVKEQLIYLPDGNSYKLFVLADLKKVSPDVLIRIKELVSNGMNLLIIGEKPDGYMGLDKPKDAKVSVLADEIWNTNQMGKGKIFRNISVSQALKQLEIQPDFSFTADNGDAQIHFTHRKVNGEHIYFISNHRRRAENIVATFRVNGLMPEFWDAETGEINDIQQYETLKGVTKVQFRLSESGSAFIVFRKKASAASTVSDFKPIDDHKFQNITNTFSVSLWAKPETFAYSGRGYLLFPAEAEKQYEKGHAGIGISMGQNGVKVFERTAGNPKLVLESAAPVEGWTLVNLLYADGVPTLYLNSKKVATGQQSNSIVHAVIGQTAKEEQYIGSFEGDQTETELRAKVLTDNEISEMYLNGIPAPEIPEEFDVIQNLNADWIVKFPRWSKAPQLIELPQLISLHFHNDFNVKHFSGTAIYSKTIHISEKELELGKIFIDLGRVENIAEIFVNGNYAGMTWKAPYRIDISSLLKTGENELSIGVTNLWANRLIGDEHSAQEDKFDEWGRIKKIPAWFNKQKPNPQKERVVFSPWKYYQKTDPLLASGLLGPVRLLME